MAEHFDKKTKELISKGRKLTLTIWISSIIISLGLYFLSIYLESEKYSFLYVRRISEIVFGAAFIGIIFSRMQEQQSLIFVREVIAHSMGEIFNPILDKVYSDFLKNYRWTCHLSNNGAGNFEGAIRQNMQISYSMPKCQNEIRVVFGVSDDDSSLKEFYHDKRYVLRWGVDKSVIHDIKVNDLNFFSKPKIRINGAEIIGNTDIGGKIKAIPGGEALVYIFKVPRNYRGKLADLTINFSVLKIVGNDSSFDLSSQFFRNTTDAEIKLLVDGGLKIKKITVQSGEITKFHENEQRTVESGVISSNEDNISSYLYLRFPILKGSSFRFRCTK